MNKKILPFILLIIIVFSCSKEKEQQTFSNENKIKEKTEILYNKDNKQLNNETVTTKVKYNINGKDIFFDESLLKDISYEDFLYFYKNICGIYYTTKYEIEDINFRFGEKKDFSWGSKLLPFNSMYIDIKNDTITLKYPYFGQEAKSIKKISETEYALQTDREIPGVTGEFFVYTIKLLKNNQINITGEMNEDYGFPAVKIDGPNVNESYYDKYKSKIKSYSEKNSLLDTDFKLDANGIETIKQLLFKTNENIIEISDDFYISWYFDKMDKVYKYKHPSEVIKKLEEWYGIGTIKEINVNNFKRSNPNIILNEIEKPFLVEVEFDDGKCVALILKIKGNKMILKFMLVDALLY